MRDIPLKTDGVSTLPAAEFNELVGEVETAITNSGLALTSGTTNQLARAISAIGGIAVGYTDSGSANAKVLTVTGSRGAPVAYTTGMVIVFVNAVANSGAVTVNVSSLGAVGLNGHDGSALASGALTVGDIIMAVYTGAAFQVLYHKAISELRSLIGVTYNSGSFGQLPVRIAEYAGTSDDYACSGSANAYVLTPRSGFSAPGSYITGMMIRFRASFSSTGTTTVNVNSLGAKTIANTGGTNLSTNEIKNGDYIQAVYDGSLFKIVAHSDQANAVLYELAVQTVGQNISNSTITQVNFSAVDGSSTSTWFNTGTDRFTPTTPGYFFVSAGLRFSSNNDSDGNGDLYIRKNGTTLYATSTIMQTTASRYKSCTVAGIVFCNGTTDYIDIATWQTTGVTRTTDGAVATCFAMFLKI